MDIINRWISVLGKLRRDYKFGGAPHKPILLLAVFSLIRKGVVTSSKIEITPELVLEFKEFWSRLVKTPHTSNFALPFYHMRSEPFWELVVRPGASVPLSSSNSIKSFSGLKDSILYAQLDNNLFSMLSDSVSNAAVSQWMVQHYFPTASTEAYKSGNTLFSKLEQQILNENKAQYQNEISRLLEQLDPTQYEEEIYIRSGVFKREIPKIYNYQCAISGMRIETVGNIQMIDACHIVPFSESHDDTIGNGISLSPNLHRAFDRGLITISDEYVILVSKGIRENRTPFSLSQFEGKKILLPLNEFYWPKPENLRWHRESRFI